VIQVRSVQTFDCGGTGVSPVDLRKSRLMTAHGRDARAAFFYSYFLPKNCALVLFTDSVAATTGNSSLTSRFCGGKQSESLQL
jgi:hypothetical protein